MRGLPAVSLLLLTAGFAARAAGQELSIGDATVVEGDGGVTLAMFDVTLSFPTEVDVAFDFATRDGSATAADGDYEAQQGVGLIPAGGVGVQLEVPVNGDVVVEPDENFFVDIFNPQPPGVVILDGEGQGNIIDDDGTSLSIDDVTLAEGDAGATDLVFTVSLSAPSATRVTAGFATRDGTATVAGGDYEARSGTTAFAPGSTRQTVVIPLLGDTTVEPDETFFVDLSNPSGAGIDDGTGLATILDDDRTGLSIDDVVVSEGDAGTVEARFTVSLSAPSSSSVGVDFRTRNGTATVADDDYEAVSGRLTLPPGATETTVDVAVNGDTSEEPDEVFVVDLSAATGASIIDSRGIGTILDDDHAADPGRIRLLGAPAVAESAPTATVTVERTGSGSGPAGVRVSARAGTATRGDDFRARSRRLAWGAGETGTRTLEIPILDDNEVEGDETVLVALSEATGAPLGEPSELELTILDDDAAATLEPVGDTELTALPGSAVELQVRATREDGESVQGATVGWTLDGDGRLADGATTVTGATGVAVNRLEVDDSSGGRILVDATLAASGESVGFVVTVASRAGDLFDPRAQPGEASVADALDAACDSPTGGLVVGCDYLDGLDDDGRRQLIEELTPRDVAAQGNRALDALRLQHGNVASRLSALRGGATGVSADQLSLQLGGRSLAYGQLRETFGRSSESPETSLGLSLDQALTVAQGDGPAGGRPGGAGEELVVDEPSRLAFFINGSISVGDRPGTGREEGFDFESQGVTAGLDYRLSDGLVLGGALGYLSTDSDLDADGGGLDGDVFSLSAYGTWYRQALYVDGILSYGSIGYEAQRNVDLPAPLLGSDRLVASGEPDGSEWSVALAAGYDAAFGANSVGGFGRLSFVDLEIDPYAESGAGPYDLSFAGQSVRSLLGELGLDLSRAVSYSWGVLQPQLRVAYLHELEDDARLIRGRFVEDEASNQFAVPTDAPDRDFFNLGLGVTAILERGRSLYLFYDTDLDRDDLDVYTISGGLRIEL